MQKATKYIRFYVFCLSMISLAFCMSYFLQLFLVSQCKSNEFFPAICVRLFLLKSIISLNSEFRGMIAFEITALNMNISV